MAAFLRHRRARVQPAEVGLPAGPRQRTPGLRRQEVAELAGMSVDYYIRLEQGRGPRPSAQMLAAISRALLLSDDERDYLFHLAAAAPEPRSGPSEEVRPGVLRLIQRLDDTPALVCNARYDVLAQNQMAAALLGGFAALPPSERNIIWRFFTDPVARDRHDPAGADQFARESVADLRAARARYPDDTALTGLIDRLHTASGEFRGLWAQIDVQTRRSTRKRLHHLDRLAHPRPRRPPPPERDRHPRPHHPPIARTNPQTSRSRVRLSIHAGRRAAGRNATSCRSRNDRIVLARRQAWPPPLAV